ncbi:MAG TPA: SLC13 family permease, partial [Patescibacteria group bacterium]|nr:SLC13 family permease [Patescibacteria group bacterium]
MIHSSLTLASFISIIVVLTMYVFLAAEKINKVLVVGIASFLLVGAQVFKASGVSSQEGAFGFIANNLDVLGFVIGMMVLVGIVKESGVFEYIALLLVKKIKGNPQMLLFTLGYLTLFMT